MERSIKAERVLKRLGVMSALDRGETLVLVGPTYELRKDRGSRSVWPFCVAMRGSCGIGYAHDDDGWRPVEFEPFSLRALGYYQRRLKRIGDFIAG